jgi:hypothetical protein
METTITRQLLDTEQRIAQTANLFGICFPLQLEPFVFAIASDLARDYKGGFWNFYALSNRGFYLAPDSEKQFSVRCHNYYEGVLSADALGIGMARQHQDRCVGGQGRQAQPVFAEPAAGAGEGITARHQWRLGCGGSAEGERADQQRRQPAATQQA